ncbi:hypothetical protein QQX98_006949 [Neonectria punicea]|uniref:Uncharacterized protein n=1 Tax=Neonectria punicea TaxID=979145 RepID=A0ABR1GZ98_9HYPO
MVPNKNRQKTINLSAVKKHREFERDDDVGGEECLKKAMDAMGQELQTETWFNKTRSFVDSQICQYVSEVPKTKKFPAVNIAASNPG